MKILYVTSHVPHAPAYGAQQRVLGIARLLSRLGTVSVVLAVPEPWPMDADAVEKTAKEFEIREVFRLAGPQRRGIVHTLRRDLDPAYLDVYDFVASVADAHAVRRLMKEYALTWIHTDLVATSLKIETAEKTVLDADDLSSRAYASNIAIAEGAVRKLRNRKMQWVWYRREKRFVGRFAAVCVCSEADRRYLGSSPRMFVLPNGYHPVEVAPRLGADPLNRLGFIGHLRHPPNADGLAWFISDVWPILKKQLPNVKLRLVGEGTNRLNNPSNGVTGLGWIPDVAAEMGTWAGMIVPVRIGSGTRVKIAEAFARRCPVVSTTYGAFGYSAYDDEHLLLADGTQRFSEACVRLLTDAALRERLSGLAYRYFVNALSWDSMSGIVEAVSNGALRPKGG